MDATSAVLLAVVVVVLALAAALTVVARGHSGGESGGREDGSARAARIAVDAARAQAASVVEQARADGLQLLEAAMEEVSARHAALEATERRIADRHRDLVADKEEVDARKAAQMERREAVEAVQAGVEEHRRSIAARLEVAAGLSQEEARQIVLARLEQELAAEHAQRVQRAVAARVGDLAPTADQLMADAIQRQDASHADGAPRASALALEGLPDDARERLLGALEVVAADTFTEVGVDDERQQVVLRGLDPVGREVARQASLEVLDRRLRAEEVGPLLMRTRRELRRDIAQLGERVLWEMGIEGRPELAELLGTLHYRFSYGQNALLHCQETGHICAALAAELRMDPTEARRAGLFHDIGKAVDHDVEGSHAIIGGEMLTVLGVDPGIVHAVKAHHFDEEPSTDLAMLTICADAISASRPGARRDTLTTYVQRLEQLQSIATRHRGVERAFPMQAGREVRVSVRPEQVPDDQIPALCKEIAREIEAEMTYPGMIKVTVIRETSATATAS
jgi:ribonucrease Y